MGVALAYSSQMAGCHTNRAYNHQVRAISKHKSQMNLILYLDALKTSTLLTVYSQHL